MRLPLITNQATGISKVATVGDVLMVYGQAATITKVREFGTVDVRMPDGRAYRVSGLQMEMSK